MRTQVVPIQKFLGLITNIDEVSIPLGGAMSCSSLAVYLPERIQRIPGIEDVINISNAQGGFPVAWKQRISGVEYLMAAIVGGSNSAKIWNITNAAEVTGATGLTDGGTGLLAGIWSTTTYLNKRLIASGTQAIQQIDTATTRSDFTGTSVPVARLIKSYLNRLYCVETDSNLVRYDSPNLSKDFSGALSLQIDEV